MKALWLALIGLVASATWAQSSEFNPSVSRSPDLAADRLIVEWRTSHPTLAQLKAKAVTRKLGANPRSQDQLSQHMDVLQLDRRLSGSDLDTAIANLRSDPDVLSVSPDLRRHIHAAPADPLYAQQWYFQNTQAAATRA